MDTSCGRVPEALACALGRRGYDRLTPVQRAVLAIEPHSADMLVSAETGTGKTVAIGLALAARFAEPDRCPPAGGAPRAIVITPTRELALQVSDELAWLYADAGVRVGCCTGGTELRAERNALARGLDIVVGSPGRLRDHIERGSLGMGAVGCVVLDEADDMLDLGFRDDLTFILDAAPAGRQTLMFSATITWQIEELARRYQRGAQRIDTRGMAGGIPDIRFEAVTVAPGDRESAIVNVLRFHDAAGAIVFCATRLAVGQLAGRLSSHGFRVAALSGALAQRERTAAMAAMRDGSARVCVATDVAARGIDLPRLELVIHADLPSSSEGLTHRSGRTGRAGRSGLSVLIVPHPQRRRAEALFKRAGLAPQWVAAPGSEAIRSRDEARILADPALIAPAADAERAFALRLLAEHEPAAIAIAFARLAIGLRPVPAPAIGSVEGLPAARPGGGIWFSLNLGRGASAEIHRILSLLCRIGQVSRQEIGRIRVQERETLFEVRRAAARGFFSAVQRAAEEGVTIRRLSRPPRIEPAAGTGFAQL